VLHLASTGINMAKRHATGDLLMKRTALLFALLLLPLSAYAQSNELGVFISTSQFSNDEISDGIDTLDVEFDEDMGYGVLYNRYWGPSFSTEFAYQKLGADLTVSFEDIAADAGDLDLDVLTATGQFHFARNAIVSPYIGGGVAYISGQAGSIDPSELEDVDLESDIDWLVNAGLNINLGRSFGLFVDGKYIFYEARGEGDSDDDAVEINPLVIAGGVKFRF
jgi:opacity protein-like surface antigen